MDTGEYDKIVWAYLKEYKSRYSSYHPDSVHTYSGFVEWAEEHRGQCSGLELKLLDKFLNWLKIMNDNPNTRRFGLGDSDLKEFMSTLTPLTPLDLWISNRQNF